MAESCEASEFGGRNSRDAVSPFPGFAGAGPFPLPSSGGEDRGEEATPVDPSPRFVGRV